MMRRSARKTWSIRSTEAAKPWSSLRTIGPKPCKRGSSDTAALKTAIDNIQATDRRSRLKQAYQLAEAQTHFNPDQLRTNAELPDVFVFSDGRVLDANELSIKGNLKYERVGTDQAGNIAVVSLSAKRNYERPNEVQVFARLANYGPEPVTSDVELWVSPIDPADPGTDSFQNRGAAVVRLLPERWDDKQRDEAAKENNLPQGQCRVLARTDDGGRHSCGAEEQGPTTFCPRMMQRRSFCRRPSRSRSF